MPKIEFIKPVDQATGKRRLLDELKADLDSGNFNEFRWIVAYAKTGPLLRLQSRLDDWKKKSRTIRAIFGIDQQGTSREALELALQICDEVYVTQERGITFHPKAYLFNGKNHARFYIGSNNLTVGGTETNFEAAVVISADLPTDAAILTETNELWNQLLPSRCPATQVLDAALLLKLVADGDVVDEATLRKSSNGTRKGPTKPKSGLKLKPPSALPSKSKATASKAKATTAATTKTSTASLAASGLAIQIIPHHNGEIFLSKTAIDQNPSFFGYPFSGMTTPKNARGTPYPQRTPDPAVSIQVYGQGGKLEYEIDNYDLNMVFYATKSEIRITASPLISVVPDYSVMVMTDSTLPGIDYELTIYRPDSPDYASWEAMCNQTMPSGGSSKPRKFGWF